jgi:hypothetical protein
MARKYILTLWTLLHNHFTVVSYILSLNTSSHNTGQKYNIWGQGKFCGLFHMTTSPVLQFWTLQLGYSRKCQRCHTMAQIFSYCPLTTYTQAQSQTTPFLICGWKSGIGTGFLLCTGAPLLKIIWLTNFPMHMSTWLYLSPTSVQVIDDSGCLVSLHIMSTCLLLCCHCTIHHDAVCVFHEHYQPPPSLRSIRVAKCWGSSK